MPPNEYKEAAGRTVQIVEQTRLDGGSVQVDSTAAIAQYFEHYYGESGTDLGEKLVELRCHENFATLAEKSEMISNRARDVFGPDDDEARDVVARLRDRGELRLGLRRTLQRHVVGLSPWEFSKATGVLEQLPAEDEIWIAVDSAYNEQLGLIFEIAPESLFCNSELLYWGGQMPPQSRISTDENMFQSTYKTAYGIPLPVPEKVESCRFIETQDGSFERSFRFPSCADGATERYIE